MKNKQSYYYIIFLRLLIVVYISIYTISGYDHFDILYNKDVALYLTSLDPVLWVIPNILNYIDGNYAKYIWTLVLVMVPFVLFRKTSIFAALIIWYIEVCFIKVNPYTNNIGVQTFLMILIIIGLTRIPYKKTELVATEENIYTNSFVFLALWINFSIYYFYSGYTKLLAYGWYSGKALVLIDNHLLFRAGLPSEIYFKLPIVVKKFLTYFVALDEVIVPFALFNGISLMKKIWWSVFILQLGLLFFMNLFSVQLIMLIYSLMVYDPGWKSMNLKEENITVYYDGYCALCHYYIKHIINIDLRNIVYYQPIQESAYYNPEEKIESILVYTKNICYKKSDAVLYIYSRIGGMFAVFAFFARLVPKNIRDIIYDKIANNRYTIFGKKDNICPIIKEDLLYKFSSEATLSIDFN